MVMMTVMIVMTLLVVIKQKMKMSYHELELCHKDGSAQDQLRDRCAFGRHLSPLCFSTRASRLLSLSFSIPISVSIVEASTFVSDATRYELHHKPMPTARCDITRRACGLLCSTTRFHRVPSQRDCKKCVLGMHPRSQILDDGDDVT